MVSEPEFEVEAMSDKVERIVDPSSEVLEVEASQRGRSKSRKLSNNERLERLEGNMIEASDRIDAMEEGCGEMKEELLLIINELQGKIAAQGEEIARLQEKVGEMGKLHEKVEVCMAAIAGGSIARESTCLGTFEVWRKERPQRI